jgi:hypothetical protein
MPIKEATGRYLAVHGLLNYVLTSFLPTGWWLHLCTVVNSYVHSYSATLLGRKKPGKLE